MHHEITTVVADPARRRTPTRALLAAILAVGLGSPAAALAQGSDAFDYSRFSASPAQGHDVLNVFTSDLVHHLGLSAGLLFYFEDDPLTVVDDNDRGRVIGRPIDHRLVGELHLTLGLFDAFSLGLAMPVTMLQKGEDLALFGRPGQVADGVAPGDLRVVPRIRVIDPASTGGFGLTLTVPVHIPIGDEDSFVSDGAVSVAPTLGLDLRTDAGLLFALNAAYRHRTERLAYNYVSGPAIEWAFGVRVPVIAELGFVGSVFGAVDLSKSKDPIDFTTHVDTAGYTVEALGGVELRPAEALTITAGAGGAIVRGVGSPDVRAWLGLAFSTSSGPGDRDGDGVPDDRDACPDEPEDIDGFEDEDGCPDPDNDGDGIPDVLDACPNEAEDFDGFEDEDGCPDHDNDQDGIPDAVDKCPNEPEDIDGFEDGDGCPDHDNDGDGIPDAVDECPSEAEDFDGLQDDDGCPEDDADGDGIPDARDKCPLLPETKNGSKDEDGCPDSNHPLIDLTREAIVTKKAVTFTADDVVLPGSFALLDAVAQTLEDNPYITKLSVEGHTDSAGPDEYNLDLSRRRAARVVEYLVSKGVAAERLVSDGFGEGRPIAPNTTPYGRARNRRIELRIIEVFGKSTVSDEVTDE